MDPAEFTDALVLTGPTASGKSAVGLILAEQLGAEIVSMDSMAVFRGLDIGTAKPPPRDRARVPHHLIDVLEPWQTSSLAWWLRQAADCCRDIRHRGRRILFVGGTPLYLKGLLRGIFEGPPADTELRRRLEQEPGTVLHERLRRADPASAARIHVNDIRRLVRALEVLELTGRPMSAWQRQFEQVRSRPFPPLWLDWPRPILYQRIDERVDCMIAAGLVEEVRGFTGLPQPLSPEAQQAAGYREILQYIKGQLTLAEAVERMRLHSHQLAKRQVTWFRHLDECAALPVNPAESVEQIAAKVLQRWRPAAGQTDGAP